jgi:hypothetical protein
MARLLTGIKNYGSQKALEPHIIKSAEARRKKVVKLKFSL